jgi:glycosyltransferase XagB
MSRQVRGGERQPVWSGWSAQRTVTQRQAVVGSVLLAAAGSGLAMAPYKVGAVALGLLTVLFLGTTALRVSYFLTGYRAGIADVSEPVIARHPLPGYSILVPLYREANVVPELLRSLSELDYPFDRLEVLLLVEHDDAETAEACERGLRPGWHVVRVPAGHPRTKPRALNVGLAMAGGELLTIYDAEDRPERDQLRKAVAEFRRLPKAVACLQARLDYYNAHQNVLTRWFTCEYATHFSLYLEGISARRHPMPLGGTSCHFRTEVIRELGGWDEWNVTEDCELGMRLAAAGYGSRTLDSVTWEEAVPVLRKWLRQRSRWVKGFTQTGLALLRSPLRTARTMGIRSYVAALASVGGVPLVLATQVFFWAVLWLYAGLRAGGVDVTPIEALFPEPLLSLGMLSLLVGNFAILLAHVSVVYQQQRFELVRYALFIPCYWLLTSLGAWRGPAQLVRKPHFWEKTVHGLATVEPLVVPVPAHAEMAVSRAGGRISTAPDGEVVVRTTTPSGARE